MGETPCFPGSILRYFAVCEDDNNGTGSAMCQIHHHRSAADSEFFRRPRG